MPEVRLTSSARRDLAEIDEYGLHEFGDAVADDYLRGFRDTFALLERHGMAGEERPGLGRGIRAIAHRSHRIFYTVKSDIVLILRIFHHSRDVRRSNFK